MTTEKIDKKRKLSKNKKRTWRATDIQDVENFLETSRLDERIGSVAAKADQELFRVDTSASTETDKVPVKIRRRLNALAPARCYAALENTSKINDPLSNRSQVKQKKNVARLRSEPDVPKKPVKEKVVRPKRTEAKFDLWDESRPVLERDAKKKKIADPWFPEVLVDHHLKNTGTNIRRVPGTIHQKATKLKAIAAPNPGNSYNPSIKDHSKLIQDVIKKEEGLIKTDAHLERVTCMMLKKVPAAQHDREYLQEMSQGIPALEEATHDDEDDGAPESNEYTTLNAPVQVKVKDRQTRRKQKEERERQLMREEQRAEKRKLGDIDRIKVIKSQVMKGEMKMANRRNKDTAEEREKPYQAHRLSKLKYTEPDEELVMPADLAGSLRTLKPQGSILKDRFTSMQKRNILAPNKAIGVTKRHKVKSYVKNTHKGFLIKPVIAPAKKPTPKKRRR